MKPIRRRGGGDDGSGRSRRGPWSGALWWADKAR